MKNNIVLILNLVIVLALAGFILFQNKEERKAYVLNQKLFEGFTGKKELEKKLNDLKSSNKKNVDSLTTLIQAKANEPALVQYYQQMIQSYELNEQQLSTKYTADIWKRINDYVAEFGKEKGYDFIFGATGDGNLMYAKDTHDVTEELVRYVNAKYESGD